MQTKNLPVSDLDLIFIENVGNLICPSAFELAKTGEGMTDWYDWLIKSVQSMD